MHWYLSVYSWIDLLATAIVVAVAVAVGQRSKWRGTKTLVWLLAATAEWSLMAFLDVTAVEKSSKIFWSSLEYVGGVSSLNLLLIFALEYTRQTTWLTRPNRTLLWSGSILIIATVWTNPWHHLFWSSFSSGPAGTNLLIYHHGPAFWAMIAYVYFLAALAIFVLVRAAVGGRGVYRRQIFWLLLSILAPIVGSLMYLLGDVPVQGWDVTPISFSIVGLLLSWNILHYRLLDLIPVARHKLVDEMMDGVVMLDVGNRIVDINAAARRLLWPSSGSPIGQPARAAIATWPDLLARYREVEKAEIETQVETGSGLRDLFLQISPLYDAKKHFIGRMIVLRDITDKKRIDETLRQLNASLEKQINERTLQLQERFGELEAEIAERKRVEATLRATEESLVQRVADQSRKLTALYEVILVAGQSLDIQEVLEQSLSKVMGVLGGEAAGVHLWNDDGTALNLAAHVGFAQEAQKQIAQMPGNWLMDDNVPRIVSDLSLDLNIPDSIRLAGYRAYLGARINLGTHTMGALSVFWRQPVRFPVEDIALFSAMADQLGLLMENVRLRQRSIQAAAMQERRRLARDLHDSVTQSLHSLVLLADIAGNRLQQGNLDRVAEAIAQLGESARQSLKEMRLLLYELRLIPLDQVNLVEALNTRLEAVEARAGIKSELVVKGDITWPQAWDGELYCIAMESLNNSLKHARATEVKVRLTSEANWVELEIEDNGCGFNVHAPRMGGMGLVTMAERAERLGGSIAVDSLPGTGTKVRVWVDLNQGS